MGKNIVICFFVINCIRKDLDLKYYVIYLFN